MKNVKYGKCVRCGKTYEARPDLTSCTCGGILDIVYDYDYIRSVLTKEKLARRENRSMWRYRELLPVEETTPCGWAGAPCMRNLTWPGSWASGSCGSRTTVRTPPPP